MLSQNFQTSHTQLAHTGDQFLQYLQELLTERVSQGNPTEELQKIGDNLSKTLTALKEQKYQVAVIAAMKAGKSTFLNAIVGADVLASESESCTVCRTDIYPIDANATPRLLEYQAGIKQPIELAVGDDGLIKERFLARTREIRATANRDRTTRFELEHYIAGLSEIPALAGFAFVDTPGPNEWESTNFDTTVLKQTTLEALRTCDAILFILDYSDFKDNTNSELLELFKQRGDLIALNAGKTFFILNKIDRKAASDRAIADVINDLEQALISFGIPNPVVYPASAWQGLLAKLLLSGAATKEHKEDFKNFFLARYIEEDEEGEPRIPKIAEIAPKALENSHIPVIEESVIKTVVQYSGWNLLNGILAKIENTGHTVANLLNTEIKGWETEIETLKYTVENYHQRAQVAKAQVEIVKMSAEEQKQQLIEAFSQKVAQFAQTCKEKTQQEIEQVINDKSTTVTTQSEQSLLNALKREFATIFASPRAEADKIRVNNNEDAKKIGQLINGYFPPIIQSFWLDIQDQLVRNGTEIRTQIVQKIQQSIQTISDELSEYIGQTLNVDLHYSEIQFPEFQFAGIDAQIAKQQEVFERNRKEMRSEPRCCRSERVYEIDIPYQEVVPYYEIDLRATQRQFELKIDAQVARNQELLKRVVEKQVGEDFKNAAQQINDYISQFQSELDNLLQKRESRELESLQVRAKIQEEHYELNQILQKLTTIKTDLESWKP